MQFTQYDLGHRQQGDVVEISLAGSAAHVRLMDSSNFSSYRSGRPYRFHGGRATRSPVRLLIPHSGHWHVAIDLQGLRGSVRTGIRVLSGGLAPLP